MAHTKCAIEGCDRVGGKFMYTGTRWLCNDHYRGRRLVDDAKNLYDFTTKNINGESVKVESLAQLRRLERDNGVVSVVANWGESEWDRSHEDYCRGRRGWK